MVRWYFCLEKGGRFIYFSLFFLFFYLKRFRSLKFCRNPRGEKNIQICQIKTIQNWELQRQAEGHLLVTEIEMMCNDARDFVSVGIDGVVIGCLDAHGDVDFDGCNKIVEVSFAGKKIDSSLSSEEVRQKTKNNSK